MTYSPENGDINDATWRAQAVGTVGGDYLVDPVPSVSIGSSSTSIELTLSSGTAIIDDAPEAIDQQTTTVPDGPTPGGGPNGNDEARVDLVTIDATGAVGSAQGTPAVPRDADGNPSDFRFPNVAQPVPSVPQPSDNVIVVAAVWVPAGVGSSEEMFADWVIPREVVGSGLNDLELLPGRDLQYQLDQANEGTTLRGDKSHEITLAQPLVVNTPGVTIRDLSLRFADGAATNNSADMLTINTEGVDIKNVDLDGNKANQPAAPDGITVQADARRNSLTDITVQDVGGYAVNVNGGYNSTRAVVETNIDNLRSVRSGKGGLVVQGRAFRTTASQVTSEFSDSGGAVLLRNGPTNTTLETVTGVSEGYVLNIADFGSGNDDTAPVENVDVDGLTANSTATVVTTDTTYGVGHRGIRLSSVTGRQWPNVTGAYPIDLSNINSASVTNSSLRGYQAGPAIRGDRTNTLRVDEVTLVPGNGVDGEGSGIFVRDSTNLKVTDNAIVGRGGEHPVGVLVLAADVNVARAQIRGNNIIDMGGNPAIRLDETNSTIKSGIVKNNAAVTIDNQASGASVIVKDNIP